MDIKKTFGVDKTKEVEGVWRNLGSDMQVLVARKGNPTYQKILTRLMRPYRSMSRSIPDDLAEDILIESMVQGLLLGWNGLTEDGVEVPYSREAAKRLLKEYPEFRQAIDQLCSDLENFKAEEAQALEKN